MKYGTGESSSRAISFMPVLFMYYRGGGKVWAGSFLAAPREVRPLMDGELRKFAAGKRCRNFNAFWWRVEADWLKLQNRTGLQLIVSLPRVNTGFVVGLLTHSLHRT